MPVEMIQRFTHEQRRQRREQIAAAVLTGKPMPDIAKEFGVGICTVMNACKENGVRKGAAKRALIAQVAEVVRAGKTVVDASIEYGVSADSLYRACHIAGIKLCQGPRADGSGICAATVITRQEWEAADWSLRDIELARVLGVTRERVRQVRKSLRKSVAPDFHRHTIALEARR